MFLRSLPQIPITLQSNRGSSNRFLVATAKILKWKLILVAVLLVCPALSSAQSSRKSRAKAPTAQRQAPTNANAEFERLVKLADDARLSERFDEAISLYGQALKIRPKWPDGWWYVGAILYQKDDYPQARDAFQNLVALEPNERTSLGNARFMSVSNRRVRTGGRFAAARTILRRK